MAWLGLPGSGLGGMNPHANGPMLWTEQFRYATDLDALYGVPIQVWSTKSLTARWSGPAAAYPAADLTEDDRLLSGSITNTLPFSLRDCVLMHGSSAYRARHAFARRSRVSLGPTVKRIELKTFLTRRHQRRGDACRSRPRPMSRESTDARLYPGEDDVLPGGRRTPLYAAFGTATRSSSI